MLTLGLRARPGLWPVDPRIRRARGASAAPSEQQQLDNENSQREEDPGLSLDQSAPRDAIQSSIMAAHQPPDDPSQRPALRQHSNALEQTRSWPLLSYTSTDDDEEGSKSENEELGNLELSSPEVETSRRFQAETSVLSTPRCLSTIVEMTEISDPSLPPKQEEYVGLLEGSSCRSSPMSNLGLDFHFYDSADDNIEVDTSHHQQKEADNDNKLDQAAHLLKEAKGGLASNQAPELNIFHPNVVVRKRSISSYSSGLSMIEDDGLLQDYRALPVGAKRRRVTAETYHISELHHSDGKIVRLPILTSPALPTILAARPASLLLPRETMNTTSRAHR